MDVSLSNGARSFVDDALHRGRVKATLAPLRPRPKITTSRGLSWGDGQGCSCVDIG